MGKCHTHLHHQGIWDAKLPRMSSSQGSELLCMHEGKRQALAAVVLLTLRKCGCFQLTSTSVNPMSLPSFSSLSLFIKQQQQKKTLFQEDQSLFLWSTPGVTALLSHFHNKVDCLRKKTSSAFKTHRSV